MTSTETLASRFDALGRFVRVTSPHCAPAGAASVEAASGEAATHDAATDDLATHDAATDDAARDEAARTTGIERDGRLALPRAAALADRASVRLRHSADHTVAALAGATGTGKSSLFNALVRLELSSPGHLRPTTAAAHACVWGDGDAEGLLDWLGVDHRFRRESVLDAQDEVPLRGLVLLDLPDMDSVAVRHKVETDRLVAIVDLVIWVLDPQKYADQTVHEGYLRQLGPLRDVTVVVFNQIDRLTAADAARCRADLARLVEDDGLSGVPIVATSARRGDGVDELRLLLEKAVAGRQAAMARLEGELDAALAELAPLVGEVTASDATASDAPEPNATESNATERNASEPHASEPDEELSRAAIGELASGFAAASGVPVLAAASGQSYARATTVPGWPRRRASTRDSAVDGAAGPRVEPPGVRASLRQFAGRASVGLPASWAERVQAVIAAEQDGAVAALDTALTAALPRPRVGVGWVLLRVAWWLAAVAALAGAGWWVWYAVDNNVSMPRVAGVTVPAALLIAGAGIALLLLLVGRALAAVGARRARIRAERRLGQACLSVAREMVAPVRAVLRDYAEARLAFAEASRPSG